MLNSLRELFETHFQRAVTGEEPPAKTIELAAAALMVEISRADSSIDDAERAVIDAALLKHFHLSREEAGEILELAEKEVDHSVSLHDFTRVINDNLSAADKIRTVELLWRVAFADGVLDKYEEYFIRKIADLLYVSHRDYIQAKHRAADG